MRPLLFIILLCPSAQAAEIPLKSIHSTSQQEGMQRANKECIVSGDRSGKGRPSGASNVFLVDAKSLDDAMKATALVLIGPRSPAQVRVQTGSHWLVVYLGTTSSTPPRWIVDGVTIEGNRIRFTYHQSQARMHTGDMHPYLYWIPVGQLQPGKYRLELYDGEDVTLMRRVEVGTPPVAPREVNARALGPTSGEVTWSASPTATSYAVLRRQPDTETEYTIIAPNVTATRYIDSGLARDTLYEYRVIARR
jgi:hypothetical protein